MRRARTAAEGRRLGTLTYFTGKPCKNGHVVERYTKGAGCKTCQLDRYKKCKASNTVRFNAVRRKAQRRYRENDPNKYFALYIRRVYGLTIEDYMNLLKRQNFSCPVCAKPFKQVMYSPGRIRDTRIDHNHKTGKVRGILHDKCNKLPGYVDDNRNHLANTITYLATSG